MVENLSFLEKKLIKGVFKADSPLIRFSTLFLEIIFAVFAVAFLILYFLKRQNIYLILEESGKKNAYAS